MAGFQYRCLRCGHEWIARKPGRPASCAKCRNPRWDEPRDGSPRHVSLFGEIEAEVIRRGGPASADAAYLLRLIQHVVENPNRADALYVSEGLADDEEDVRRSRPPGDRRPAGAS